MNLIKEIWNKEDIKELKEYEKTLVGDPHSCEWEQRIVNTKLECFGKTNTKVKLVFNEIKKGNFLSFLDNLTIENHFESILASYLISYIKDFDTFEKYLDSFVLTIDNWASSDTLSFKRKDKNRLYELSKKYLKSNKEFVRRTGVNIYFELIKDDRFFDKATILLNDLKEEDAYYVNMAAAWLLSCMFIENRTKTIEFFKNNTTNDFIINKAISKTHDSFRADKEDKEMLKMYRRK